MFLFHMQTKIIALLTGMCYDGKNRREGSDMFCHKCGRPWEAQARFCSACGAELSLGIPRPQPSSPVISGRPPIPPVVHPPVQHPVVYIYRDAPIPVKGSYRVPLILLLAMVLIGLILYFTIPLSSNRALQQQDPHPTFQEVASCAVPELPRIHEEDPFPVFSQFY